MVYSADVELHPNVTGEFVQPGSELGRTSKRVAAISIGRAPSSRLSGRKYFGPVSVAAHADGGLVAGRSPPPQQLFELGGDESLPGYDYKEFVGDRAALFRVFAQLSIQHLATSSTGLAKLSDAGREPGHCGERPGRLDGAVVTGSNRGRRSTDSGRLADGASRRMARARPSASASRSFPT